LLIKFKQLIIDNRGYERDIYLEEIYLNPDSIVSVANYGGLKDFLVVENSEFAEESFCLTKVVCGSQTEEIIILGTAHGLSEVLKPSQPPKSVLNG